MCIFGLFYYRQRRKSRQHTCAWSLVWIGSERWVGSWSVWTPTIIPCSLGMTSVATRQSSTVQIVSRVFFRSAASRGCIQALQPVGSLPKITFRHKIRCSDDWIWKLLKWPKFSCFCWKNGKLYCNKLSAGCGLVGRRSWSEMSLHFFCII
jgi:hypothetical protein